MRITLGLIVSWMGGLFLTFIGLIGLITAPIGGLIILAVGLLALPPVRTRLFGRADIEMSRWALVAIVLLGSVVGFGMLGSAAISNGDDTSNSAPSTDTGDQAAVADGGQSTETAEPTAEPTATATATPSSPEHQPNEKFVVGDGEQEVEYSVDSVETASQIGGEYGESADAQFVVVELTLTNNAKESFTVSSNNYKLVDGQDRTYDVDSDAIAYAENPIIYEQVDPGVSKTGTIVFDVPEDQSTRRLEIQPAGVFSTARTHYVVLK